MDIELLPFSTETNIASNLIRKFWYAHSHYEQSTEDSLKDLKHWTAEGHIFYLIKYENELIGFVHLGNRGAKIDWLEDLFILPEYQGRGLGTQAIFQVEAIVRKYSESLYIEAAARNEGAIRLYQKLGYDCLNTITVRKDFCPEHFETIRTEKIADQTFTVKKYIE